MSSPSTSWGTATPTILTAGRRTSRPRPLTSCGCSTRSGATGSWSFGHDLGGGIAQILATTSSERVLALGVVDGVCFDGWPVPVVKAMKLAWPLVRLLPASAVAAALVPALRPLFGHGERAGEFIERFVEPWRRRGSGRLLAQHLRTLDSVYTQAVAPFLPQLAIPTEVVWGRKDHQMKQRYGQRLARTVPGARLTWVEDASHFVPADRPDEVVRAVEALISRLGEPTTPDR
ncbi:alpha/beta fold hydrolase [Sanguibacter suaedae]|uniref:alpha/beta fold hydrolase n=1 Tax=Sanguibacter suaedae TaxID=2795737 RepID=UPI00355742E2